MVQKSPKKTTKSATVTKVTREKAVAKKTAQPSTSSGPPKATVKKAAQPSTNSGSTTKTTRAKNQAPPCTRKPAKPRRGTGVKVTDEQIRARAFEIYLARNGASGDAASDWIQAERELRGGV